MKGDTGNSIKITAKPGGSLVNSAKPCQKCTLRSMTARNENLERSLITLQCLKLIGNTSFRHYCTILSREFYQDYDWSNVPAKLRFSFFICLFFVTRFFLIRTLSLERPLFFPNIKRSFSFLRNMSETRI